VIFKIAERTKARTGGLLRLSDLYLEVKRAKPQSDISIVDLEKVVAILQKDGVIPGLRQIFAVKYIELVPLTLTEDQNIILEIAAQSYELSIEKIILKTKWPAERIQRALNGMENLGIAVYQVSSRKWVFPAFITNDKS
jgi:hypothetical protein